MFAHRNGAKHMTNLKTGLDTLSDDQIRAKLFRIEGRNLPPGGARAIENSTRVELISWWKLASGR
jgi:hypothetical protein